jgi:hypothetical protein
MWKQTNKQTIYALSLKITHFEKTQMGGQTELPDWMGQKVFKNAKQILIRSVTKNHTHFEKTQMGGQTAS